MDPDVFSRPRPSRWSPKALAGLCSLMVFLPEPRADPFAEIIRSSDPLPAEEQLNTFHPPPGFEVQLVAAEPDIGKPINMAFDAKGRLWITESVEYPFPALPGQKGRDRIRILEDFDERGRARKITTFADGLNIPIGLQPYRNGVVAFSIPHVYFFQDTTGDGKADKKKRLYGPWDYSKDTHGMASSFRRGFDGWLYGCHGFNNTSAVSGADGHTVRMHSGNTYRFRPDGSRIEQFTWGQVNPFGLAFDHLGNLYSADCHSSPIYQLIRGGHYPSFGKPHDGLGFAPAIMTHSHGSTAIAGVVFYAAANFPAEYRNNLFIGNVMTSRINRDSIIEHGSTWLAKEEPDFIRSDDPWFRPVDLQLGPDGAIYVADFYNRIIGHYEVPLGHPGRDRERGRIWRIVYEGERAASAPASGERGLDLSRATAAELVSALANDNLTVRMLATDELADRIGQAAAPPLRKALDEPVHQVQLSHVLWALHRLDELGAADVIKAGRTSRLPHLMADAAPRVHMMRILAEMPSLDWQLRGLAVAALGDDSPHVRRAAADALGRHPAVENIRPLLDARHAAPDEDTFLLHTIRIALREQFRAEAAFEALPLADWTEADALAVADIAPGVPAAAAGLFLLRHVRQFEEEGGTLSNYLRHIARHAPIEELDALAEFAQTRFAGHHEFQIALLKSVMEGAAQRGAPVTAPVRNWGAALATELLASIDSDSMAWRNSPLDRAANPANPWFVQLRRSADGDDASPFLSSLPGGETLTGILRSKEFVVPAELKFFIAGHDGFPNKPPQKRNVVRLRDARTGEILAETWPPRNDVAQPVVWDLAAHRDTTAFIELVDGDDAGAYAWLAVGRFSPAVVTMPRLSPAHIAQRQQAAAELAATFELRALEPSLAALLEDERNEAGSRVAAGKALLAIDAGKHLSTAAELAGHPDASVALREGLVQALAESNRAEARDALADLLRIAPGRLEARIAVALASHPEGAERLLEAVSQGHAAARVLQDRTVRERLLAARPRDGDERIERLTRGLTPPDVERQRIMEERRAAYDPIRASIHRGARVFAVHCAACHQIDGAGGIVGPQLDGIGNRGLERLIEDILDPNRNVDHAFRYSTVFLEDDQVIAGLFRREEGEVLVFADATGQEISVSKGDIIERVESEFSLMPDNYDEILSEEELNDLLAFLLGAREGNTSRLPDGRND